MYSTRLVRLSLVAAAAVLLQATPAGAQEETGTILGYVDRVDVEIFAGSAYLIREVDTGYELVDSVDLATEPDAPEFRFQNVPPGEYIIDTKSPRTAYTYVPGTSNINEADRIQVRAGDTTRVRITVTKPAEIVVNITGDNPDYEIDHPTTFAINEDVRRDLDAPLGWSGSTPSKLHDNVIEVGPGSWFVLGANYREDEDLHWNYFPEWAQDTPYGLPFDGDPITAKPGEQVTVDIELAAFWEDMLGGPFNDDMFWMQRSGLSNGCGHDRFCADDRITRGEFAAFLARALQLPPSPEAAFSDTNESIFEDDINRIAAAGITYGCNPPANNQFCVEDPVTRGEMAALLVRAMEYEKQEAEFIDDDQSVFEADIERLATADVTVGCNPPENDRFCPDSTVTRGEMAHFLGQATGGVTQPFTAEDINLEEQGGVQRYQP